MFLTFVRNVMGIPVRLLPDADPAITYSYTWALDVVSLDLQAGGRVLGAWGPYERAVYNLGGHTLIEFAQDQSYPLSALSFAGGTVTGTTTDPSTIVPGDRVAIMGISPLAYSGPQNLVGQGYPQGYVVVQATPDSTHFQYVLARDPGTATLLAGAAARSTFFTAARSKLRIDQFVPGMVTSTSDVSTSVGLANPDFMRGLTIENLQLMKTAYGRAYLSIAQKLGPTVWGLS
jgi:hypothetical protein